MGSGKFDSAVYATTAASYRGKKTHEVFTTTSVADLNKAINPYGVKLRESRDSADNPNSLPIIVALDVTGSMGMIADHIARKGLGTLFESMLDGGPVPDPHVMFMAVGDVAAGDSAPLQVSQFEADKRIIEQLTMIYLEHGGGGNQFESYNLPWYFAAYHTEHDSIEKRGKKGYLFTVGDENAPDNLTKEQITKVLGSTPQEAPSNEKLIKDASEKYNVYHVIIAEGNFARGRVSSVKETWKKLLGQNVIVLNDYKKLAETIVSTIEVAEGKDPEESAKKWGAGRETVLAAIKSVPRVSATP